MESRPLDSLNQSMHDHPGKWVGIAAIAGFGLGLIARLLRHRAGRRMPDFVIIEAC